MDLPRYGGSTVGAHVANEFSMTEPVPLSAGLNRWLIAGVFLSLAVGFTGSKAQAQNVTVTANPLTVPDELFNLEQRERIDNGRDPREYILTWATSGDVTGLQYRVSFDRDDIRSAPQDLVPIVPGSNSSDGLISDGVNSITISEDDLINVVNRRPLDFGQEGVLNVFILIFQVDDTPDDNSIVFVDNWTFPFDFQAPPGPPVAQVSPGERSIEVRWSPISNNDVDFFEVVYCTNVSEDLLLGPDARLISTLSSPPDIINTSTQAYILTSGLPCDESTGLEETGEIADDEDTISLNENIPEASWVAFSVLSVDPAPFLNRTETATVFVVRTEPVIDFFELQNELGGGEDGGFCFIATAAYGSYAHPVVRILRAFRDYILAPLPYGKAVINLYYTYSPPLALLIKANPLLAAITRILLVVLVGGLFLSAIILFYIAWRLSVWFSIRVGKSQGFWGFGLFFVSMVLLSPAFAEAQIRGKPSGSLGWAFEFKAGPFLPQLAENVDSGGLAAWEQVYGSDRTRALVNVGLELQLLRETWGTVSVLGTAGFIKWEGRGVIRDAKDDPQPGPKGSSTFNLVPLSLTAGYHFDVLLDRTSIPLAPYVRGGLAYYVWWNTRDDGSISRFTDENADVQRAQGGKFGLIGTLGVAFSLNVFDPTAAARFRQSTGVRSSYIFIELQLGSVDGFGGDGFDFSETTWLAGIKLEL